MKFKLITIFSSRIIVFFLLSVAYTASLAQDWIVFEGGTSQTNVDATKTAYSIQNTEDPSLLDQAKFKKSSSSILNLGISSQTYWIKLQVDNKSDYDEIDLVISNPNLDTIELFYFNNSEYHALLSGERVSSQNKIVKDPYHTFRLTRKWLEHPIYLRINSEKQLVIPLALKLTTHNYSSRTIFYGVFSGIIIALFLYNLVLAFLVRERVYYIYLVYLFSIYFAQANLIGLSQYFFGDYPELNQKSLYFFSGLVGISALAFMNSFLELKVNLPKANKFINFGIGLYFLLFVVSFFQVGNFAYILTQINGMYAATLALSIGTILTFRGNILAKLYLFAWSVFTIGIIIFVLKDYGLLPYNNFTKLTMTYGVMIEVILLSIALAQRINTLKKDNERAQERIIEEMSRNESLIKNQNLILEDKVKKRTEELEHTLHDLKQAQVKLIDSEKMASLGLLTAGIAHEINNPINYVTANVIPLRENVDMLTRLIDAYKDLKPDNFEKQSSLIVELEKEVELDYTLKETKELIDGIEEGAKRTYHIVDGLRTFSRSDTTDKRMSDINIGIESTLSVLKSQLKGIKVSKALGEDLPMINCQLGKLNQVFLNLINNAIQAIQTKHGSNSRKGELSISSAIEGDHVLINIKDNGNGIKEEFKNKIFEPFYTSKPVGEGTGLGLSISYSIIEDHAGEIDFNSEEGIGTDFWIKLPIK